MGRRVLKLPSTSGFELYILAQKEWGSLIFLPVWLVFWTFGGILAMKWILHPGPSTSRAFLILWLAAWVVGGSWLFISGFGLPLERKS